MNEPSLKLLKAPIVEAVLDIDCDMQPGQQIAALEKPGRDCFLDRYPTFRIRFLQEHQIESKIDAPPKMSVRLGIQALQFLQEDGKQLVQLRAEGFSFNRLAPYTSLDEYLPEMERTWKLFIQVAKPVQIRRIRLRYINRFCLPMEGGRLELNDYLKIGPRLPDEEKLKLLSFLHQHAAVEQTTGNKANIVLTAQTLQNDGLPIIFDIGVERGGTEEPENWDVILSRIQSLRSLKNRIFRDTLTERCLKAFQQ